MSMQSIISKLDKDELALLKKMVCPEVHRAMDMRFCMFKLDDVWYDVLKIEDDMIEALDMHGKIMEMPKQVLSVAPTLTSKAPFTGPLAYGDRRLQVELKKTNRDILCTSFSWKAVLSECTVAMCRKLEWKPVKTFVCSIKDFAIAVTHDFLVEEYPDKKLDPEWDSIKWLESWKRDDYEFFVQEAKHMTSYWDDCPE